MEEWKDIEGYEGKYKVSSLGRVKSLTTGIIMKQRNNKYGYPVVTLGPICKRTPVLVHRLVASHFLINDTNLPEVNHKDEDKQNNAVSNLEWCSHKYNTNYGTRTERASKNNSKAILQMNSEGNVIKLWESAREIEKKLGIYHGSIAKCCKGYSRTAGGYRWKYA